MCSGTMLNQPKNPIIEDIIANRREFLGGDNCNAQEVQKHFDHNVLIDGLNREESQLVLSTLGSSSNRIYLMPLDKGLSRSKVFAGRYETAHNSPSKPYVFKIGPLDKIEREYRAIKTFVVPHIQGIDAPIFRRHTDKGLIVQSIAGLSQKSKLESLKESVRRTKTADKIIMRLLNDRLAGFYDGNSDDPTSVQHSLRKIFAWYLKKVTKREPFPLDWGELKSWVQDLTGLRWKAVSETIKYLKGSEVTSRSCIVHGDLHSQNILIDEKGECWPIDFGWCHDKSSPILDFTMLECSLKFLAIHQRSDLRSVIEIEHALAREPFPKLKLLEIPYRIEIANVLRSISAVREFSMNSMKIKFEDYRKALCLMTYVHSTHPQLNRPLILASLQILSALERKNM